LAKRIARKNSWALQLAKRSVNRAMDEMGFANAIESCFDIHHLGHGHATTVNQGRATVLVDLETMKRAGR
jgi:enoyl-CoA hydratase